MRGLLFAALFLAVLLWKVVGVFSLVAVHLK